MEDDRTKRRRIIISPHLAPQLDNLTEILLAKVAEYLPQISRALLAVALTTDSSRWRKVDWNRTPLLSWLKTQKKQPSPETKTVARMNKWDTLDFSVCESSLASKLSDDDIAAVLSCINAVKYMKKLKLTGCIGITGCGLEPLRGSVVLEWIDANVIYWKEERMKPMMCERTVLPILDSVIDTPGNSLKYVNLPESFWTYGSKEDYNRGEQRWNSPCTTKEYTKESNVEAFLERWKRHLVDLEFQCTHCSQGWISSEFPDYCTCIYEEMEHIQDHVCCKCLRCFCNEYDRHGCEFMVTGCVDCGNHTCPECVPLNKECILCSHISCQKCRKQSRCVTCGREVCEKCHPECKHCNRKGCIECLGFKRCQNDGCNKAHCGNCYEEGTTHDVKTCQNGDKFCFDCRFSTCSKNWSKAPECCLSVIGINKAVAAKLHVTNEENKKFSGENKKLKEDNEVLTEENRRLSVFSSGRMLEILLPQSTTTTTTTTTKTTITKTTTVHID